MKNTGLAALGVFISLALPATGYTHGEERIGLEPEAGRTLPAGTSQFRFQMIDLELRSVIEDADVLREGGVKTHLFVYDKGLRSLQHVHAEYSNGSWAADLSFAQNGNYFVWSGAKLAVDNIEGLGSNLITVVNGTPASTEVPDLTEIRSGVDGTSAASISGERIIANAETMLSLAISRTDGSQPEITPWLGHMAHAIIVYEDGDWLSHAHGMSHMGELMLHAKFPFVGNYRVWLQFVDAGQIKTITLAVRAYRN